MAIARPGGLVTPATSAPAAAVLLLPLLLLAHRVGLMGRRFKHAALRGVRLGVNVTAADRGKPDQGNQREPSQRLVSILRYRQSTTAPFAYNRWPLRLALVVRYPALWRFGGVACGTRSTTFTPSRASASTLAGLLVSRRTRSTPKWRSITAAAR